MACLHSGPTQDAPAPACSPSTSRRSWQPARGTSSSPREEVKSFFFHHAKLAKHGITSSISEQAVVHCVAVKQVQCRDVSSSARPLSHEAMSAVLHADVEYLGDGDFRGTFPAFEAGTFQPYCVLQRSGTRPPFMVPSARGVQLTIDENEPLAVEPVEVSQAAVPILPSPLPACLEHSSSEHSSSRGSANHSRGVALGSLGPGRWLPIEGARAIIKRGESLPSAFPFYWAPYLCQLEHFSDVRQLRSCQHHHLARTSLIGDSVTSMLFNGLLTALRVDSTRDKAAEHMKQQSKKDLFVFQQWQGGSPPVHIALETPQWPVPTGIELYGSPGATPLLLESGHRRPHFGGSLPTTLYANWGMHDLICGQMCRLGNRGNATAPGGVSLLDYAQRVRSFAQRAVHSEVPRTIWRTTLPRFTELACQVCSATCTSHDLMGDARPGKCPANCSDERGMKEGASVGRWRWDGVDFHGRSVLGRNGSASGARPHALPFPCRSETAYGTIGKANARLRELLLQDEPTLTAARDLNSTHHGISRASPFRVLDAYEVIASSPTSRIGMPDGAHPKECSAEGHVLSQLFLNMAC